MSALTPMVATSALLAAFACLVLCLGLFVTGRRKTGFAGIGLHVWAFACVVLAVIGILLMGIGS